MKRQIPLLITAIVGSVLVISVFIPHDPFGRLGEDFSVFFDIIAVFAFILGGGNLIRVHGNRIYRKAKDWPFSFVTIGGFLITLIAGAFKIGNPDGIRGDVAAPGSMFTLIYDNVFTPLQATMFSILALVGCGKVNKENYDKIKIGMSYEEVVAVLGKPDTCEEPVLKTESCMWGSSEKQIKIKFVADTVAWRSSKGI